MGGAAIGFLKLIEIAKKGSIKMKTLKKSLAMLLALVMSLGCMSVGAWATDEQEGFYKDPSNAKLYHITSLEGFKAFRDSVNAGTNYSGCTIMLEADIDLEGSSENPWEPINGFAGTFDGGYADGDELKSHSISNLYVNNTEATGMGFGLFGSANGTIQNLNVINASVWGNSAVAVVIGLTNGSVKNVHVSGNIQVGTTTDQGHLANFNSSYIGGIVGYGYASLENCSVDGAQGSMIVGGRQVGGLFGFHGEGSILVAKNCSVSNITLKGNKSVGGVVGWMHYQNRLEDCSVDNVIVEAATSNCVTEKSLGLISGTTAPYDWSVKYTDCSATDSTLMGPDGEIEWDIPYSLFGMYGADYYKKNSSTEYEYFCGEPAATVNGEGYLTFAEAVTAANNGDTITLLKDIVLKTQVTLKNGVTLDGNNHKLTVSEDADSDFMSDNAMKNASSSAIAPIVVNSGSTVTIKNAVLETKGYARCNISSSGNLTLQDVKLIHVEYSSRGNDALQLNGPLKIVGKLEIEMGSNTRYWKDKQGGYVEGGFTNRAWGGISFNNSASAIDFSDCTEFVVTDQAGENYGLTQAPIHIYNANNNAAFSAANIAEAFGWFKGEIPSNLVKVIGDSWSMTGYAVEGSEFLTRYNYAYVVTSATETSVYYQSLDRACATLKSGDTINADPTGKLANGYVAIKNTGDTWTVKTAVEAAKDAADEAKAEAEKTGEIVKDAGYTAPVSITLGTTEATTPDAENGKTDGSITVSTGDTIKYVAEADATGGTGDNQTTGSASEVVITSADGNTTTTAYVVTNAEGTTTAITSGNIGNEVTGKSEGGDLLTKDDYAELFDMPAVLANLAAETSTPVTDVKITMYAENTESATSEQSNAHNATYEVHPVASVGNKSFEVTDPNMLKADSYNVKMYVDAQYADKNLRLTHYLANGGTEDLGVYPVKTEVVDSETKYYVEYAMTSFSVVGINTTDSSYVLSITDTEAAYNSTDVDQTVVAGQTVTMQVKVTDAVDDSAEFIYADGTISYDDDRFELVSCTPVTDWSFLEKDSTSNTGNISFKVRASSSVYPVTSGSAIMTLVFKAKSGVSGDGAFALTNATAAKVADTEGNAITASTYGDAVTVEKTYTVVVTKANGGQATLFVEDGEDFEYTISPYNADYTYQVTATVDGNPVAADKISVDEAGEITIDESAIKGVLRVSISAFEVNVYSEYVTGYYLVTVTDRGNNGSAAYSFNGSEMYNITRTSDASKYSAYLINTIAAGALLKEGENKFTKDVAVRYVAKAATAAGELVIPTLDVNGTGTVDQNDYLRVFVCYEVADGASVESRMADWLRADYDGNNKVNTVDFAQVYNAING